MHRKRVVRTSGRPDIASCCCPSNFGHVEEQIPELKKNPLFSSLIKMGSTQKSTPSTVGCTDMMTSDNTNPGRNGEQIVKWI